MLPKFNFVAQLHWNENASLGKQSKSLSATMVISKRHPRFKIVHCFPIGFLSIHKKICCFMIALFYHKAVPISESEI